MSRYAQLDSDEANLPEGMRRTGYDADTQTYTYEDEEGELWEGAPGARYGQLHRAGEEWQPMTLEDVQILQRQNQQAWRYMLPFFLLMAVVLLGISRFLSGYPSLSCPPETSIYTAKPGDYCWAIAKSGGVEVEDLVRLNKGLDCTPLKWGTQMCVPFQVPDGWEGE